MRTLDTPNNVCVCKAPDGTMDSNRLIGSLTTCHMRIQCEWCNYLSEPQADAPNSGRGINGTNNLAYIPAKKLTVLLQYC